MLVLKFRNTLLYLPAMIIFLLSCDDVEYQLDNEFDPENLNLSSPTIFFHPSSFESIKVGESDTLEFYSYKVQNASGAHLQVEFDNEIISIDSVVYGDFFMNGINAPIMLSDQEDGFLNIYIFLQPTLGTNSTSGTMSMAKIYFTVNDEGLSPIRYTDKTVLRNEDNVSVFLNSYGEGLINAIQ